MIDIFFTFLNLYLVFFCGKGLRNYDNFKREKVVISAISPYIAEPVITIMEVQSDRYSCADLRLNSNYYGSNSLPSISCAVVAINQAEELHMMVLT